MLTFLLSTRSLFFVSSSGDNLFDIKIGDSGSDSKQSITKSGFKQKIVCTTSNSESPETSQECQANDLTVETSSSISENIMTITYSITNQATTSVKVRFGAYAYLSIPTSDESQNINAYRIGETKQILVYNPKSTTRDRVIFDFGSSSQDGQKFPKDYGISSSSDVSSPIDPFESTSKDSIDNQIIGLSYYWQEETIAASDKVEYVTIVKLIEGIPITASVEGLVDKGNQQTVTISSQYLKSQNNYYVYYSTTGSGEYTKYANVYDYSGSSFSFKTDEIQKSTTYYFYLSESETDNSNTIGVTNVRVKVKPYLTFTNPTKNKFYKSEKFTISDITIFGDGQLTLKTTFAGTEESTTYTLTDSESKKSDISFKKNLNSIAAGDVTFSAQVVNEQSEGADAVTYKFNLYDDPTATCSAVDNKLIFNKDDINIPIKCTVTDSIATEGKYSITLNTYTKTDVEYQSNEFNIQVPIASSELVYKAEGYKPTITITNNNDKQVSVSADLTFKIINKPVIESPSGRIVSQPGQTTPIVFKIKDYDNGKTLYMHYKDKGAEDRSGKTLATPFTSTGSEQAQDYTYNYEFPAENPDKTIQFWLSMTNDLSSGESDEYKSGYKELQFIGRSIPVVNCYSDKDTYAPGDTINVKCNYSDVITGGKYKYTFNGQEHDETSYDTNEFSISISQTQIPYKKDGYPLIVTATNNNNEILNVNNNLKFYIVKKPEISSSTGPTVGQKGSKSNAITFTIKDNDNGKVLYMYCKEKDSDDAVVIKLEEVFHSNGSGDQTFSPTITFPSSVGAKEYQFWLSRFAESTTTDTYKSNDFYLSLTSKDPISTIITWPTNQYFTNQDQITINLGINQGCSFDLIKTDKSTEKITIDNGQNQYNFKVTELGYDSNNQYTLEIQNLKDNYGISITTESSLSFGFYYRTKPKITESSIRPKYLESGSASFTLTTKVEDKDENKDLKLKLKIDGNDVQNGDTFTFTNENPSKDWTIDISSLSLGQGSHNLKFYLISDNCSEEICSEAKDNVRRSNIESEKSIEIVGQINFKITTEEDKNYPSSNPNGITIKGKITGSGKITFSNQANNDGITVEGTVDGVSSTEKEFTATIKYPETIKYGRKTVTVKAADNYEHISTQDFHFWIKNEPTISDISYPQQVKIGEKFKISCKVTDQDIANGKNLFLFVYDSTSKKYDKITLIDQSGKTHNSKEYNIDTEGDKQFKLILTEKDSEPTEQDIVKQQSITVKAIKPNPKNTPTTTPTPQDNAKQKEAEKKKKIMISSIVVVCLILIIIVVALIIWKMKKSVKEESTSFSISDDVHFNDNESILDNNAKPMHDVTMENPLFLTTNHVESDDLFNNGE